MSQPRTPKGKFARSAAGSRQIVSMTLSFAGLAELDKRCKLSDLSRGKLVERLLGIDATAERTLARARNFKKEEK